MIQRLNAAWHKKHPMPPRATVEQRIAWHLDHARQCACRPIPAKLHAEIRRRARRAAAKKDAYGTDPAAEQRDGLLVCGAFCRGSGPSGARERVFKMHNTPKRSLWRCPKCGHRFVTRTSGILVLGIGYLTTSEADSL
jgi:hypothetical protein